MRFPVGRFTVHIALFVAALLTQDAVVLATPSDNGDVLQRRGTFKGGNETTVPTLTVTEPSGGWTVSRMVSVAGTCSDATADPVLVNINGARYYMRTQGGSFSRKFPAARGKNNVSVECVNRAGTAKVSRTIDARIPPTRLKLILTSDTDGVYTDLHIYEPDGAHVYWAQVESPSGGLFFLNEQGESGDQPGYGPYLYVHQAPPRGTFRVAANYWPGGARQHTLATLDIIVDEGLPSETRRRVRRPLSRPSETETLAYVTFAGNRESPKVFVPGQDPEQNSPIVPTPSPTPKSTPTTTGFLSPDDEVRFREAVVALALQQARNSSPAWDNGQRDCAGLVRFAYREATRPRTALQREFLRLPNDLKFPPLSKRARDVLPDPARLWQVKAASSRPNSYQSFADAETLLAYNFHLKSRRVQDAKSGDILVFKRDLFQKDPYHLMIFAESVRGRASLVAYHNGQNGPDGKVRVVPLPSLLASPDSWWRPTVSNSFFVGVFEWNRIQQRNIVASAGR